MKVVDSRSIFTAESIAELCFSQLTLVFKLIAFENVQWMHLQNTGIILSANENHMNKKHRNEAWLSFYLIGVKSWQDRVIFWCYLWFCEILFLSALIRTGNMESTIFYKIIDNAINNHSIFLKYEYVLVEHSSYVFVFLFVWFPFMDNMI